VIASSGAGVVPDGVRQSSFDRVSTEQNGTLRCAMQATTKTARLAMLMSGAPMGWRAAHPRPPRRHRGVSRYRVFMLAVFCAAVLADGLAARCLTSGHADIVGAVSLMVWVATLLGSFGLGPLGRLRDAIDAVR